MSWEKVRLENILLRKRELVNIKPSKQYKLITIKLHHKGVVLREEKCGSEIKSKMSRVRAGDFVLSGIDARNGAFGIVPDELDNAIISNDFWCLEPNEEIIKKEFLLFITSTPLFDFICNQSSDGTTQRIRLQKAKFFNYEINVPPLFEQEKILNKLKIRKVYSESITEEQSIQLGLLVKLRQQILQDAVNGKLVPQNPKDEPANGLLERIRAEKEKMVQEKKFKKEKPLPPIKPEEIPFEIPENWKWCRLGDVCTKIGSGSTPRGSNYSVQGTPFFRSQNIHDSGLVYDDIKYINQVVHKHMAGTAVNPNDLLLNITGGSLGRCALVPVELTEGNVSQHVSIIRPLLLNNSFLHKLVLSPYFQSFIFGSTTGAGREGLPKYNLEKFVVPIPPLSEQNRIVAKVDKLMSILAELEHSINQNKEYIQEFLHLTLSEALTFKHN
jgi:type I restriction enzyme S subunit